MSIEKPDSPEPCLIRKGYEEIGGVTGALENRANLLYQSFSSPDQLFVRQMFMQLVQLGEENTVTRRRANWERLEANADSIDQLRRVVGLLANQRLIVTDEDTVEVAHEALLTEWTLLHGWIEENRENIRLGRLLEAECREWQERFKKSDEALLAGAKLATILEWKEKIQPKLPVEEAEFLRKSLDKRDRDLKAELERIEVQLEQERKLRELAASRQKEAEQKTRIAIAAGCLLTVFATLTIGFAIQAEQRKNTAIAALISEPKELFKNNNQLEAMIASVKALQQLRSIGGENTSALNELKSSVIDKVREYNRLQSHKDKVLSVSFSLKGQTIASASSDKTVKLWTVNGKLIKTLTGHRDRVWSVKFSPDGNTIASASIDKTVRLWKANGEFLRTLIGYRTPVYDVSFSPDNKTIAASTDDGEIILWNTITGNLLKRFQDQNTVYSVDFGSDGQTLASAGYDGSVKLWELKTGNAKVIGRHQDIVSLVRFSPDRKILASSSYDGTIKLWKNGHLLKTINTHQKEIYSLAFSANGEMIASASKDRTIKLWLLDGTPVETLIGHKGEVNSVIFISKKSNEYLIASASDDQTVRLWKIDKIVFKDGEDSRLESLLMYSCDFLYDYLKSNKIYLKNNSHICENVISIKSHSKSRSHLNV